MALGSTQPLTEMSTRNSSWGKGGRYVRLTTLPPSCADCLEIWEPQPPGTLRACQGIALPLPFTSQEITHHTTSARPRRVHITLLHKSHEYMPEGLEPLDREHRYQISVGL